MRSQQNAAAKTAHRPETDDRVIAGLALLVVCVVTGAIIFAFGRAEPTVQAIATYLHTQNTSPAGNPRDRDEMMARVAEDLQRLTTEQRTELWQRREMRDFFGSLTPEEQAKFFELIWPRVNELMAAFNKLPPAQRRKLVQRAIRSLRAYDEGHPQAVQEATVQRIITHGFRSFYSTASVDSKMDAAPRIEEMQRLAASVRF